MAIPTLGATAALRCTAAGAASIADGTAIWTDGALPGTATAIAELSKGAVVCARALGAQSRITVREKSQERAFTGLLQVGGAAAEKPSNKGCDCIE